MPGEHVQVILVLLRVLTGIDGQEVRTYAPLRYEFHVSYEQCLKNGAELTATRRDLAFNCYVAR